MQKLLFHLGLITGYLALSIPMAVFSGYSIHDIDTLFKALKANSFGLITVHVPEVYVRSGISAIFLTVSWKW